MPPKPRNVTLAEVVRLAAKNKTFARKLMKNPREALDARGLKLPAADLRTLAALQTQTDRMVADTVKLREMMISAGIVSEGGLPPGVFGPPPPWPWPIEWNDEKGTIGTRIRDIADTILDTTIVSPEPVVTPPGELIPGVGRRGTPPRGNIR